MNAVDDGEVFRGAVGHIRAARRLKAIQAQQRVHVSDQNVGKPEIAASRGDQPVKVIVRAALEDGASDIRRVRLEHVHSPP